MKIADQFEEAQRKLETLTVRPSNEEFLELYALFKQATVGDNTQKKPGPFDLKKQYKWKYWDSKKGMATEEAMNAYIEYVNMLLDKYKPG